MNSEIIESRKFREEIFREARALAKTDKCFLCEQKNVHFCNSHLIPHFILKNIAHNGKVKNFGCFAFKGDASLDSECGLSNAGTFHFICRKCDSYYFSDYENESNIRNSIFSSRFFAQIIIKNFLSRLYKKNTESHIPDLLSKKCDVFFETQFDLDLELDKRDFYEDLMRQRGIIENSLLNRHHILFQKKLTYKVPFAVQAHMALHRNINGEIINDVYCRE